MPLLGASRDEHYGQREELAAADRIGSHRQARGPFRRAQAAPSWPRREAGWSLAA
ncbi:MAG: hypothetical protein ACLP7J_11585 [Streptosporangiaceae bacterium]